MHEFTVMQQLVDQLLDRERLSGEPITEVRVRASSAFAEEPLEQAFEMLTQNTALQSTQLIIDRYKMEIVCPFCGLHQVVNADDLIGHIAICTSCGAPQEIDESHGLELISVNAKEHENANTGTATC